VLTVCEVLAHLNGYIDTSVAVVGRMERTPAGPKLSAVRKTTTLGIHQEPGINTEGRPITTAAPNEWVLAARGNRRSLRGL
jgi:hypothetical protein